MQLHFISELPQNILIGVVIGHIRGEHHFDDDFSDLAIIVRIEVLKDVKLILLQKHECLRHMVILKHRLVIVEQCHFVLGVNQEAVTKARVVHIVHQGAHYGTKVFQCVQIQEYFELSCGKEDIQSLQDVCCVGP